MGVVEQLAGKVPPPPSSSSSQKGEVRVIPYNSKHDPNAHQFLPYLWQKLLDDHLTDLYFPGQGSSGFSDFVSLMSSGSVLLVVVQEDKEIKDVMGFATHSLAPLGQSNSAICGFIFLKDYWDGKTTKEAALVIERFWFDQANFDLLIGIVAEHNAKASAFLKKLGWQNTGFIPSAAEFYGQVSNGQLWCLTKEQWKGSKG